MEDPLIGEIVNLTWADVDLQRRVVKVRPKTEAEGVRAWRVKTGEIRDIPVNDFLADALARHPLVLVKSKKEGEAPKASPYVLSYQDGTPYTDQAMRDRIRKHDHAVSPRGPGSDERGGRKPPVWSLFGHREGEEKSGRGVTGYGIKGYAGQWSKGLSLGGRRCILENR
jgi:hypothetical protein